MSLITKVFGTRSEREVKKLNKIIEKIDSLSDKYKAMSEDELRGITVVFRERLKNGETLDDLLPDAFAAVREASSRVLGKRHYTVQLIGGIIIHQGRIAEMKTGEGKTLMATLPAYLNALEGKGVHIVTVNDYLARRDSEWMGKVYNYLGMTVGLVVHGLSQEEKQKSYNADITYGTNNEFGFDYLRDNMVVYKNQTVQRGHHFAIVDEVDSILIDEARTPLIISGPGEKSTDLYQKADKFVRTLKLHKIKELDDKQEHDDMDGDYIVDEKAKTVVLTPSGTKKAESFFGIENLSDPDNSTLTHHINQAIRAHGIMQNDVDYVLRNGEVMIVDSFTGRIMPGRRYSNGLHQAIEAKEGVKVQSENRTHATITFQNFFRLYNKLSGMTGTALTEEAEFREIYNLDVVEIPTNKPMIRKDMSDVVYKNTKGKYEAIVRQIEECNAKGQPVLVGTVSVEKSELLSDILKRRGIKHNVLNAKYHDKEAEIIAQAGKFGAVTISTNMAGRGTDIMLGGNPEFLAKNEMRKKGYDDEQISVATSYFSTDDPEVLALRKEYSELESKFKEEIAPEAKKVVDAGGLFILGTERHESRRIDNQLRGRAGRQGDPGASKFYLSLEDDLMRLFGSERVMNIVDSLGLDDETPIDAKILSNSIENAQKRLEAQNFNRRKTVLTYDDVMNQQRSIIYKQRQDVLNGEDIKDRIISMIEDYVNSTVDRFVVGDIPEEWNIEGLRSCFYGILTNENDFLITPENINQLNADEIRSELLRRAREKYEEKEDLFPDGALREIERIVLLRNVDNKWIDHIDAMDDLESSIGLSAYGQKNPVTEYRLIGSDMFEEMIDNVKENTARMMLMIMPRNEMKHEGNLQNIHATMRDVPQKRVNVHAGATAQTPRREPYKKSASEKVGRNDPCPCGSGKKYKKCCGKSESNSDQE